MLFIVWKQDFLFYNLQWTAVIDFYVYILQTIKNH